MSDLSNHVGHVVHGVPAFLRDNWHWLAGISLALYWMSVRIWRRLTEQYVTVSHMNACRDQIIKAQRDDARANAEQHKEIVRDLNEGLTNIRRDMLTLHSSGRFHLGEDKNAQ